MKCFHCGYESEENYAFCPKCGLAGQPAPATNPILLALKDKLFLILCIAMSASCILSMAADSLPLINILITVFLWLTYAQARKDIADAKHLRCVSGTVYAQYVITYVLAGLTALVGIIFAVSFGSLSDNPAFLSAMLSGIGDFGEEFAETTSFLTAVGGGIVAVICIFAATLMVVVNLFTQRYIHRFAQSVYQSVENGIVELRHAKATKIWLCIVGAFAALNLLSSLSKDIEVMLAAAADCLCAIIPVLLINKYLITKE